MIKRHSSAKPPATPERLDDVSTCKVPERDVPDKRNDPPPGDEVRQRIGHELRRMFESVVDEPVPEKFRRLIDELTDKSGKR